MTDLTHEFAMVDNNQYNIRVCKAHETRNGKILPCVRACSDLLYFRQLLK